MKNILSQRAALLKPSATLAISAKEKELKSQGIDVIGFGAGEPDFPTALRIREAAKRSLDRGETFYTPVGGTPDLKKAIIQRFTEDYGLEYKPEEILVSCGAKHSIYNILQAILDPGDEVIVFAPYWVSYPEMIALAGGSPVIVPTAENDGFVPDPERVRPLLTSRTKAMLINSPSNPSGTVYPEAVLRKLAEIAEQHDLLVISDEIYDKLIYDGMRFTSFASIHGMKDRCVLINGVSKTYAMTGFRIGYMACPRKELVKAATDIQSQSTSNPSNTAQAAAVEALTGPQDEVSTMRQIFERRRDLMVAEINSIPGIFVVKPPGAFYAFVNTSQLAGRTNIADSTDVANYLLKRHHVASVPGGPFGSDYHIRLSFTTSDDVILEGMKRIRKAFQELV
jgi:aspartate aminotransferase